MEFSLDYEIKWNEYYHIIVEQMRRRFFIISTLCGIYVTIFSILGFIGAENKMANFYGVLISAAFIYVDLIVLFVIPRYFIDRSNFKYEKMYVGAHHTTVNETGIYATYEFGGLPVLWNQLGSIIEKRYNFYFYTSRKQHTFLPKVDMTKEQIGQLRELIRKYADKDTQVRLRGR